MDRHEGFLRAILAAPHDPAPRLVYSDWLEEQGDEVSLRRAEFLRVECALDGLAGKDRRRRKLLARLGQLREALDAEWWRLLDCSAVENCLTFAFKCPKRWDPLHLTHEPAVRHCDTCQESVYYCGDVAEARQHAAKGHCVAIDTRRTRWPGDVRREAPRRLMGRVRPHPRRRIPLPQREPPPATAE